jgi:hypothetical protein
MTLSESSPAIAALFISDAQFLEESGVAADDPLLKPHGLRARAAAMAAGSGVGAALLTAIVMVPAVRWPAGLAFAAIVVGVVSATLDLDEVALVATLASVGALVWLGFGLAAASGAAIGMALAAALVVTSCAYAALRLRRARKCRAEGYDALSRLRESIERYNALVRALDVRDRLSRARGSGEPVGDEAVLRAIRTTRENLVRAVRVQRVLRDGRDVVLDADALRIGELVPVEALRIEQTAEAYSELAGETLAIAAEVQQAYDELCAETESPKRAQRRNE